MTPKIPKREWTPQDDEAGREGVATAFFAEIRTATRRRRRSCRPVKGGLR